MINLKSAEIHIALSPLLSGQINVKTIKLIEPTIDLEVQKDGKKNWAFLSEKHKNLGEPKTNTNIPLAKQTGKKIPLITFDDFTIVDGRLIYRDLQKNITKQARSINARIVAASPKGPFQIQGDLKSHGTGFTYDLKIGELIQDRTLPVNIQVGLQQEKFSIQITGTILNLFNDPKLKGTIRGKGENLAEILKLISDNKNFSMLTHPFSLDGTVNASPQETEISALNISLAKAKLSGDFTVEIGEKINFSIRLAATRLNTEGWNIPSSKNSKHLSKSLAKQKKEKKVSIQSLKEFSIPNNLYGSIILSVDALNYRNGLIRDLAINANIGNGSVNLNQLSFQFPGGSDFNLFGDISTTDDKPEFIGSVDLTVNDLHRVLSWLGSSIDKIPPNRLRKLSITSNLLITNEQIGFNDISLKFDSSRVTGAATFALRKRLSFGLSVLLDRINIDAYLKGLDSTPLDTISPPGRLEKKQTHSIPSYETYILSKLSAFNTFDANINATIKKIIYNGKNIRNLVLDGTLHEGNLKLRKFNVGQFAGTSASIKGNIYNLDGEPSATNLIVRAKTKSLDKFFKIIGVKPSINPRRFGFVTMDCQFDGSLFSPKIKTTITAAKATLNAAGKLSFLPIGNTFDMSMRLRHKNVIRLARTFGSNYLPSERIGSVDLSLKAVGDLDSFKISDLKGKIGKITMAGDALIDLTKQRSKFAGEFQFGPIIINHLLPSKHRAEINTPTWYNLKKRPTIWRGSKAQMQSAHILKVLATSHWSNNRIDLSGFNTFDADLILKSPRVIFDNYMFKNVLFSGGLDHGTLKISRLYGKIFDGELNSTATIGTGKPNKVFGKFKLSKVNIANAFRTNNNKTKGILNLDVKFESKGSSVANLVSQLDGTATFGLENIDIIAQTKGSMFSGIYGLFTALNQFGRIKKNKPANISGSFAINNGIALTKNIKLVSNLGNGRASGTINLPKWHLDLNGTVKLVEGRLTKILKRKLNKQNNSVPFSITGKINAPKIKVDSTVITNSSLPIPATNFLIKKTPKKVQELLKGILEKGILKKQTKRKENQRRDDSYVIENKKIVINPSDILNRLLK